MRRWTPIRQVRQPATIDDDGSKREGLAIGAPFRARMVKAYGVDDGEALRGYRQRLRDFLERSEQFCRNKEITYHRVGTDMPVEEFMLRQLKGLLVACVALLNSPVTHLNLQVVAGESWDLAQVFKTMS